MVFVLSNGQKIEEPMNYPDRPFAQILLKSIKEDGEVLFDSSNTAKDLPDKRVNTTATLWDSENEKTYLASNTYLLAKNEEFEAFDDITEYMDGYFASDADYFHKVEVHIMMESWNRKFYFTWKGQQSLHRFMSELEENFIEALDSGEFADLGLKWIDRDRTSVEIDFWNYNGEFITTQIELRELMYCVAGVRVVAFDCIVDG